jgi:hypothetical protein
MGAIGDASGAAGMQQASGGGAADCPGSGDYSGEPAWKNSVQVARDVVYCATFDENRTLEEELRAKAKLRLPSGRFALPDQTLDAAAIRLPFCIETAEGRHRATAGSVRYTRSNWSSTSERHAYVFNQPAEPGGRLLTTYLNFFSPSAKDGSFELDGTHPNPNVVGRFTPTWCDADGSCTGTSALVFDACSDPSWTLNRHRATFDEGEVAFSLQIGTSSGGTEPGSFVRAVGVYRGTAFDQTDYYRLVYRPAHHHHVRNFAVLFTLPIQGACGLEVSGVDGGLGLQEPLEAHVVDCQLDRVARLTNATVTRLE